MGWIADAASVGRRVGGVALLASLLCAVSAAHALPKIEFPPEGTDQIVKVRVLPQRPVTEGRADAKGTATDAQRREAQARSIAELFRRYDRSMTQQRGKELAGLVIDVARQFRQEPFAVAALIVHESSARPDAVSKGGDYGLMQVRWRVHKANIMKEHPHVRRAQDLFDPRTNLLIGTKLLAGYRAAAPDLRGAILRYSAGNEKLARKVQTTMKELEKSYRKHLKALG